jgi:hypothetical protein
VQEKNGNLARTCWARMTTYGKAEAQHDNIRADFQQVWKRPGAGGAGWGRAVKSVATLV